MSTQKPEGRHLFRPRRPFGVPLPAIVDFADGERVPPAGICTVIIFIKRKVFEKKLQAFESDIGTEFDRLDADYPDFDKISMFFFIFIFRSLFYLLSVCSRFLVVDVSGQF